MGHSGLRPGADAAIGRQFYCSCRYLGHSAPDARHRGSCAPSLSPGTDISSPATVISSESYDESYDYPYDPHSARACVYDNGSPFIKRGSQLDSCGRDAYCCAGGEQAGKSNCENAMSAQQTALALGVSAASIRACCHFGGYDTSAPAHVTVAADGLDNAHRPCPQLASG